MSRRQAPAKGTQMKMSQKKFSSFSLMVSAGIGKRKGPPGAHGWCYGQLWWSQGTRLAFNEAGGEAEGFPWPPKAEVGTRDVHKHSMGVIPGGEHLLGLLR